ncbi:hypothetical protein KEM52_000893 [Ascosphaera acerosa]|nr:hypothetical protein KEM52_000893 [Ascosphaera acerosa]
MVKIAAASVLTAVLGASCVEAAGLYGKGSPVLQLDAKSYDRLIARSNHTSIVEFYAPWCGHCQSLKPAYEKAAKALDGLANVAAVNCDEDKNKPFCSQMDIKGFPTLKIAVPSKKPGRPVLEEYKGKRAAKAISSAVVERMPNHVKRLTDQNIGAWLAEANATAKAVVLSKKGVVSATVRALATDFLGSIRFAQVRDKEKAAVRMLGVDKYPALIVLPGGEAEARVYDGAMEKRPMMDFLSEFAAPNRDALPRPKSTKKAKEGTNTKNQAKTEL